MNIPTKDWLAGLRKELEAHFKPELLGRTRTVFNFEFDDDESLHLVVQDNTFFISERLDRSPTITIYVSDHRTLKGLLTGSVDGMNAFIQEKYRADGNIVLSQLLLYLFKHDHPITLQKK